MLLYITKYAFFLITNMMINIESTEAEFLYIPKMSVFALSKNISHIKFYSKLICRKCM